MDELRGALTANQAEIERALGRARGELDACRERCAELEELIARAEAVLGIGERRGAPAKSPTTLHEAMRLVLNERDEGMSAVDLAREVDRRGLYRRRDGQPAGVGQVHARVHNYPQLFVRDTGRLRLRRPGEG